MKIHRTFIAYGLGALMLAAGLTVAAAPDESAPNAAAWHQRMHERVQARLDALGKRLQITPAQQDAWNAYVNTVESTLSTPPTRPAADADAATIARFRADLAARHAQKLAQIADATAKLQEVLDPEQRKTLDQAMRRQTHDRGHHPRGQS